MNRIIYILLTIVFFQLIGIGYIKFVDEKKIEKKLLVKLNACNNPELDTLVNESIKEILNASKKLPQSTEYTVWDKKTIEHISKKILKPAQYNSILNKEKLDKLTQQILQESNINTITIVKEEERVALNKIEKNKKTIKIVEKKENETIKTPPKTNIVEVAVVKKEKKEEDKLAINKIEKKRKSKITKRKIVKKDISITKKLEKYAKTKLGQKYVWGATGPNRFDCSGFTKYVFRSTVGIKIPRVSRDQAKVGKYIKYKDLRRGDMVFFDTEKKFTRRVNHVGIYLSNGNFIHASSARKKVIITNFRKKPFYKRRFLWGRRIINKS